jgi:glycosyltransferase involved in cell wall biosynthesis
VVLPARLLRDKGVGEFVNAARLLKERGCAWRMALVGTADYANPSAVPLETIKQWVSEGVVEWWGHREDMPAVYEQAGIVCLPSHREGMPKCLLEAAAAGRPVVTCDVAGCRDAVIPGKTADLVPARDAIALADVLQALINDPDRRSRYGSAGRELAIERYSIEVVVEQTIGIYEKLTANARR